MKIVYIRDVYKYISYIRMFIPKNGPEYSRMSMSFMLCTKRNLDIGEIKIL